jgi:CheY-like chemotaxis protein
VYLPRAQSEPDAAAGHLRGRRRACRVLLLDDEREILSTSGEMLRRMGHEATLARDGAEAVAACREAVASDRPFDVAILDLTIPGGMGGREAGARMREIDRHIRLIASTGYSNDAVMGDHKAYGFQGVLPKPYRREELQAIVETAAREAAEDSWEEIASLD